MSHFSTVHSFWSHLLSFCQLINAVVYNMHLPAAEVLHETCFSENYTPAEQPYYPHSGTKSGHPMEHQQHCAVPQMFQGVPLPLYCPLPTQNLTISRHMTQQPSNTHHPSYLPYLNVPNALSNEPGYGYHIPPNYISYNLPQFSQSQLPTFPSGQHLFPSPTFYIWR